MRQQNATLFLDHVDQEAWLAHDEVSPELFCIYGPYINQRVMREVCGNLPQDRIVVHSPTTHHDAHWHHGGRSARVSLSEVKRALNADEEIEDTCTFVMRDNLKMREEKDGYLVSDRNTAYFVNNSGSHLLKVLGNRVQVGDIKLHCAKLGIPEQVAMEFFKRLVMFGLYEPI